MSYLFISLAGSIALWFSHASLFILPGVWILIALGCLKDRSNKSIMGLIMVTTLWLLSFALLYYVSLKSLTSNEVMLTFWQRGFIPPPTSLQNVEITLRRLIQFVNYSGFHFYWLCLVGLLFLIGSIDLIRSIRPESLLLLLPFCITFLASALHKYAFVNRLILFLLPLFYILIVHGMSVLVRKKKSYIVVLLISLIMIPFIKSGFKLTAPITMEEIKPLLAHLILHRKENDTVYVSSVAWPVVEYYHRLMNFDRDNWTRVRSPAKDPSQWEKVITSVAGHPRVWFLISHIPHNGRKYFQSNTYGKQLDEIHLDRASLYLYNFEKQHFDESLERGDE